MKAMKRWAIQFQSNLREDKSKAWRFYGQAGEMPVFKLRRMAIEVMKEECCDSDYHIHRVVPVWISTEDTEGGDGIAAL